MRKNFHFVLQGKGGVGKTTVSTFITQYVKDYLKQDYLAIDTDQVNASFASFKGLNVETIKFLLSLLIDSILSKYVLLTT